jgi:hypothetical protein
MIVRNYKLGEELPEQLKTGFEGGNCMPEWYWVVERDGRIVASLIAAPAHIVVILLRLVALIDIVLASGGVQLPGTQVACAGRL